MPRVLPCFALLGTLAVGACAVAPPTGPSVMALPAKGKTLAEFQQDDGACRQYADQQIGNVSPGQAAQQSAINSAALGTVLGAAAGAAIGAAAGNPGMGAAIGGGTGLLFGGAAGANAAQYSGASLQRRYDIGYIQCMSARGESVPTTVTSGQRPYSAYGYGAYAYPGYYYYPAPPFYYGTPGY